MMKNYRLSVFFLVVQHTVTVSLKFGIFYLTAKLFTDTFVLFSAGESAGTVSSFCLQSFTYKFYYFCIFV